MPNHHNVICNIIFNFSLLVSFWFHCIMLESAVETTCCFFLYCFLFSKWKILFFKKKCFESRYISGVVSCMDSFDYSLFKEKKINIFCLLVNREPAKRWQQHQQSKLNSFHNQFPRILYCLSLLYQKLYLILINRFKSSRFANDSIIECFRKEIQFINA